MGEGVIDFAPPTEASASAGYTGDIEVEIFNADVWATDPDEVLTKVKASFSEFVGEGRADPATGSATNGAFQREGKHVHRARITASRWSDMAGTRTVGV